MEENKPHETQPASVPMPYPDVASTMPTKMHPRPVHKSKWLLLLIVGFIIIFASVSIVQFLAEKEQKATLQTPAITTPTPTPDPTTGWKRFYDEKSGISFRYPAEWITIDNKNGTFTLQSPDFKQEEQNKTETQAVYGASMLFMNFPSDKSPTINLESQVIAGTDTTTPKQLTNIEQSTIQFYPDISAEYIAVGVPEFVGSLARISKDDTVYSFDMTYLPGYESVYRKTFIDLLSSIRFYSKKNFSLTQKLKNPSPEPAALKSLDDDTLLPISCTPTLHPDEPNSYTFHNQRTGEYSSGVDEKYMRLINNLRAEEPKDYNYLEFIFCETETGQIVAKYEKRSKNDSIPEVIFFEENAPEIKRVSLPVGPTNYHCPDILALTNDYTFYLSCVDEETQKETYFEIDLPSETTINLSRDS